MRDRIGFMAFLTRQFVVLLVLMLPMMIIQINRINKPYTLYPDALAKWRKQCKPIKQMNDFWKMVDGAKRFEASGLGLLAKDFRDVYVKSPAKEVDLKNAKERLKEGAYRYEGLRNSYYNEDGNIFIAYNEKNDSETAYRLSQGMQMAIYNYLNDGGLKAVINPEPKKPDPKSYPGHSSRLVRLFSWETMSNVLLYWVVVSTMAFFVAYLKPAPEGITYNGPPPFPENAWSTIHPTEPGLHLLVLFLAWPMFVARAIPMFLIRVLPTVFDWVRDVFWALLRDDRSAIIQRLRHRRPERNIYSDDIILMRRYVTRLEEVIARRPALANRAREVKVLVNERIALLEDRPLTDEQAIENIAQSCRAAGVLVEIDGGLVPPE